MSFGEGDLHDRVDKLETTNGKLCAEINRQELEIRELREDSKKLLIERDAYLDLAKRTGWENDKLRQENAKLKLRIEHLPSERDCEICDRTTMLTDLEGLQRENAKLHERIAELTHYHPPTIEDVLYTYGQSCIRAHEEAMSDDAKREMLASLRKEFEMKLREVIGNE